MTDDHAIFQQQFRHVPKLDKTSWLLIVDGFVTEPLTLNYNTLTQRPCIKLNAALMCAGHTPEKHMLAEANWEGIPISDILATVRPTSQARHIAFHSADGYATSLPIDEADNITLIHTMNGKPLPIEHGSPVRVLVTGLAGYKQPKWITHITLTDSPVKGFWERRGLPSDGIVNPIVTIQADKARYQVGEAVRLSGIAYAGRDEIQRVVVSVTGETYPMHVHFGDSTPIQTTFWHTTWIPSAPGFYNLKVTATSHPSKPNVSTSTIVEVIT